MKYNVVNPFKYKGIDYAKGEEVSLPAHAFKVYGGAGFVEKKEAEEALVPEKETEDQTKVSKKK